MKTTSSLLVFLGVLLAVFLLAAALPVQSVWAAKHKAPRREQASIVAAEITAFANHLALRPKTAIDFSKVSGEYCYNLGLSRGKHMTHYAIDPLKNQEDVIDFIDARPLMKAGADFSKLPLLPDKLGKMKTNQWYFTPANAYEPHHGMKFSFPLLMRAGNVK